MIDRYAKRKEPLLVSHYWDSETSKAQRALLSHLERKLAPRKVHALRIRLGFDRNHVDTGEIEDTQRGRSFLFFAMATLAASSLAGRVEVVVPENGLIGVDFRRELTRDWSVFPLRSDPCLNPPLLVERRGHWSDRHGVTERYPTLASAG